MILFIGTTETGGGFLSPILVLPFAVIVFISWQCMANRLGRSTRSIALSSIAQVVSTLVTKTQQCVTRAAENWSESSTTLKVVNTLLCLGFLCCALATHSMLSGEFMQTCIFLSVAGVLCVLLYLYTLREGWRLQESNLALQRLLQDRQNRFAKSTKRLIPAVLSTPTETYMAKDDFEQASVADLLNMLSRRGKVPDSLEKQKLLKMVKRHVKRNEVCCVCLDVFQPGDPLRILPRCHHELHSKCLDKWVATFADPIKKSKHPSCPLCKQTIS